MKTVYNTATSLDGYIATDDHSLEWLFAAEGDAALEEHAEFMKGVGAMVMGASTYEWTLRHESSWPYDLPTWVLTHRELPQAGGDVRLAAADSDQALRDLHREIARAAGGRDVWLVGGGGIAADLARLGLLGEVVVSIAPVTLGSGKPLLAGRADLRVQDVHRSGDFACIRYAVL